jgi:hypothetical protein
MYYLITKANELITCYFKICDFRSISLTDFKEVFLTNLNDYFCYFYPTLDKSGELGEKFTEEY